MKNSIRFVIKEEIQNFLNEKEYANGEIIKFNEIDLTGEYNKLNKLLFDNELPNVPMKWSNRKGNLGHVKALRNRFTREVKIVHLAISSFHAMPYYIFKDTLAHEMIHVKQLSTGEVGSHGMSFLREMRRINGMGLGFNIDIRSEDKLEVSDTAKLKAKTLIAFIMNIDGKYYLTVTTSNVYATESDYVFNLYQRVVNSGKYNTVEFTIVESNEPELMKFRIARTFRSGFKYSELSDELLDKLLQGKIIKNVIIKRNVPSVVSEKNDLVNDVGNWEEIIII